MNVGGQPNGVAVNPAGTRVYVANGGSNTVSVIDTATNTVIAAVNVGVVPSGVAVSPDGSKVYVTNVDSNSVSVIDTATNAVTATINTLISPCGDAVSPDGLKIYVTNYHGNSVSVIDASTNTVTATVNVGASPLGISITSDGSKVYVANFDSGTVSVINTTTNTVIATLNPGAGPIGFGQFISPVSIQQPIIPLANFSTSVSEGYFPLSVQFTDLSKNEIKRSWDFGDGSTSTAQNPTHVYSVPGTYRVTLTASNAAASNSVSKSIYVKMRAASSVNLTSITLDGENSTGVTVDSGAATTNLADPLAQVGVLGKNGFFLNRPFPGGALGEVSIPLEYGNNTYSLIADKVYPGVEYFGAVLFFNGAATPPQISVYNSNGGTGNFSVQPAGTQIIGSANGGLFFDVAPGTSVYTAPDGTKVEVVSFTIDSKSGITDDVSWGDFGSNGFNDTVAKLTLKVTPPFPVAAFSASPTSGSVPLKVKFTDNSTGSPTSWKWTFGDGSSSTQKNPEHIYKKPGNYTVSLTVKNAFGSSLVTKLNYLNVLTPKPLSAAFSAYPASGKAPLMVSFTDKSAGSPIAWS